MSQERDERDEPVAEVERAGQRCARGEGERGGGPAITSAGRGSQQRDPPHGCRGEHAVRERAVARKTMTR